MGEVGAEYRISVQYEARLYVDDGEVHRYRKSELRDDGIEFLLSRCQETAFHPTPHLRRHVNDQPVRRRSGTGLPILTTIRRCHDCGIAT
ncbi:hypothetical protein [Amycolatopsis sp. H20-H5]|uniref:hypothetical protein n=1 Tax=Amycolatopsis sp. H20-H5 TaxID=3046309 RepID=UPI002DBE1800|nr:hypothetical protein [Amycolatopsis sp. H20-H5]MEC3982468.1 hypothetical protein [Amycolatopsis sp. H20-H5]